jgi:hypothetical protein
MLQPADLVGWFRLQHPAVIESALEASSRDPAGIDDSELPARDVRYVVGRLGLALLAR